MDFVDYRYYLFLPLALFLVLAFRGPRRRVFALLALSWGFFLVAGGGAVVLLVATTVTDFVVGRLIGRRKDPAERKALLAIGIVSSLTLLVVAKYTQFLAANVNALLGLAEVPFTVPGGLVIPTLAISFYTFESISYLVDVYRGDVEATESFLEYAAFIAFFPHLVAGPIVRARDFLPQIHEQIRFKPENLVVGTTYIVFGLAQKLVVADTVGVFVDGVFRAPAYWELSAFTIILGVLAFGVQIYCDFAGYTHIAIGSAKFFNLDLPQNFNFPYLATSPRDFWRRWHITLSTWLRDYLYVPLGGSKRGVPRTYLNLMITMGLGGLWHGASWTFVIWGLFHGAILVANHALAPLARHATWVWRPVRVAAAWLVTQYLIFLGWLFFRAASLEDLLYMTRRYLLLEGVSWELTALPAVPIPGYAFVAMAAFVLVALASVALGGVADRIARARPAAWSASMAFLVFSILTFYPSQIVPFIYFQF